LDNILKTKILFEVSQRNENILEYNKGKYYSFF